jgi:hypothetical protein
LQGLECVTLVNMNVAASARAWVRWAGAVVLLCSFGACSAENEASSAESRPSTSIAQQERPNSPVHGSASQGEGSNADVAQQQGNAESAAGQIASEDGLRVENQTGEPIALTFPDGDTAWLATGKSVVILKACRDMLPLRAVNKAGAFIAQHGGPCRQRDTWTLD